MQVYKNLKVAVHEMFFKEVLGLAKPIKIKKNTVLADFCRNKKFEKEYVDMLVDKTERVFKVSIRKIKNKPLEEILIYIEQRKVKHSMYGGY